MARRATSRPLLASSWARSMVPDSRSSAGFDTTSSRADSGGFGSLNGLPHTGRGTHGPAGLLTPLVRP